MDERDYLPLVYSVAFFSLCLGRVILAIFDIVTEFNSGNYGSENFFLWKIGSSFQMFAVFLFFVIIEKRVVKGRDKYALVILFVIFWALGLLMVDIILATNFIIIAMLFVVYIPLAYLYIAKISEGVVRKKALYVFSGFVIVFLASLMTGEIIIDFIGHLGNLERIQVHQIAFLIKASGSWLLFLGFK
ncbi:MAG: hypothetical protein ACTSQJ_04830 [Promethearchaeota archaeon]